MKHGWMLCLAISLVGVVGCHHDEPAHPAAAGHAEQELKGPLGDFHKVFAPIWHAEKGPARTSKACNETRELQELANKSVGAAHDGAHKGAAQDLSGAVAALITACNAAGRHDVDEKLGAVHNAFHKASEH